MIINALVAIAVFVLPILTLYFLEHAPPCPYDDNQNGNY